MPWEDKGPHTLPHRPSAAGTDTDTHRLWVILLVFTERGIECQEGEFIAILLLRLCLVPLALLISPLHMLTKCTDVLNFFRGSVISEMLKSN